MSKRERETAEFAAMLRRMCASLGRRFDGGDGDVPDLAEFATVRKALDEAEHAAVAALRRRYGYSWAQVARPLGTTRQAAQMRYGREPERRATTRRSA
ncbi:hypothetical protein [Nocardioides sp. InS609-2]|uniref:hypothetical protein n=1 Tax=Nocardioides sp. InS609-2 TaxID=2760705 RepID=UPI0020C0E6B0|nr:hypothetical protein [Nocardioides sp. InS609-2]